MPKRKYWTRAVELAQAGRELPSHKMESELPPEILQQIFLNLRFQDLLCARQTCHRWRNAIGSCPALRDKFRLKFPHDKQVTKINRNYNPPPTLPASSVCFQLENYSKIGKISSWWPQVAVKVTALTLRGCEFSVAMLRHAPNLKSLEVKFAIQSGPGFVGFRLGKLEKLTLDQSPLGQLSHVITQLKVLEFRTRDDGELRPMVEFVKSVRGTLRGVILEVPVAYLDEFSSLKLLELKQASITLDPSKFEEYEHGLLRFARAHPSIEDLTIVELTTEETLTEVLRATPKLKRLELIYNEQFDPDEFSENNKLPSLPNVPLPNLKYLKVECGCDAGWPKLRVQRHLNFPNLTELHLSTLELKGKSWKNFFRNSLNLYTLTLIYCDFKSWNHLLSVFTQLKVLRRLSFENVRIEEIEDDHLAITEPIQTLRYLRVGEIQVVPGETDVPSDRFSVLFQLFPQLTEVFVECGSLIDIETMGRSLAHLERLNIDVNMDAQKSLESIKRYCKQLKDLDVRSVCSAENVDIDYFINNLDRFVYRGRNYNHWWREMKRDP